MSFSLSEILKQRSRTKIIGLLLVLLIVALSLQFIIGKNPKSGKAVTYTISASGSIPANYENADVIITGAATVVDAGSVQVWSEDGTATECSRTDVINPADGLLYRFSGHFSVSCEYQRGSWSSGYKYYYAAPIVAAHTKGQQCNDVYSYPRPYNYPTCDSKRHFNSLTIQNGATLTHGVLVPGTDFGATSPFALTLSGQKKKVDIEAANDLTLNSGGRINVDGKGYPAVQSISKIEWDAGMRGNGYGPGGGYGTATRYYGDIGGHTEASDGGNHIGIGGNGEAELDHDHDEEGDSVPEKGNHTIYGSGTGDFEYGSAGGTSYDDGFAPGGAGGGVVNLVVRGKLRISNNFSGGNPTPSESKISANGATHGIEQCVGCGNDGAIGGSGAGGSIVASVGDLVIEHDGVKILTQELSSEYFFNTNGGQVTNYAGAKPEGWGTNGEMKSEFVANEHIYSEGGDNNRWMQMGYYGGAGGGGKIVISKIKPPTTVQKILDSIDRVGAGDNGDEDSDFDDNFNPYSLQKDDKIKVTLKIGWGYGIATIKDDWLQTNYQSVTYKCVPQTVTVSPPVVGITDPLIWPDLTSATTELSYECVVSSL